MSRSSITDRARVLEGRVPTYSIRDSVWVNWRRDWDYELPSFFGIHSTLDDLAQWDLSRRNATRLKPATLAQMWTPAKVDNGQYARVIEAARPGTVSRSIASPTTRPMRTAVFSSLPLG